MDPSTSTTQSGGPGLPAVSPCGLTTASRAGGGRRTRPTSMRAATAAGSDDPCIRRDMRRIPGRAHS
jgi:hypothetical protein